MKRPMLISGISLALSCCIFAFSGIRAAITLAIAGALVFILYFIKPLNLKDKIIIPVICFSVILGSLTFICYNNTKILPFEQYNYSEAIVSGKVNDIPVSVTDTTIKFTLKSDAINEDTVNTKITVYAPRKYLKIINPFDYITIEDAFLMLPYDDSGNLNASSFSDGVVLEADATEIEVLWECTKTPYYYCLKLRQNLTEKINQYLHPNEAGFLNGMLFGDKSQLQNDTLSDFRAGGIAHLLAVSGLHTSMWCGFLIAFLSLFKIKEKIINFICIMFLCAFCIISAFTPSVLRASLMMLLVLLAPFFSRRQDSLNSLGFAITVLLLANPYIILSVSFQLSVCATFGVLLSEIPTELLFRKKIKFSNKILSAFVLYIASNLLISALAGIFTAPVSAYYFAVFSLVSPITNLLCVKIAFWGMMTGFIGAILSFIPVFRIKTIVIYIFKAASFLLNTVMKIADFTTSFKFATIPIHKETLASGFAILTISILLIFLLYKKHKPHLIKITAVLSCASIVLFTFAPLTNRFGTTLTIYNVGNGISFTVRSGLKYAFFNLGAEEYNINHKTLPLATCESLDFLYISAYGICDSVSEAMISLTPAETVITPQVKGAFNENDISLPANTIISENYSYSLNNQINFEIVNTYPINYVIMTIHEKTVLVYNGDKAYFASALQACGSPDILILTKDIPAKLPVNVDSIIVSSGSEVIINKNLNSLKCYCDNLILTAEKEEISWHF